MVKSNFFDSKVISNWIHIINSKEDYQKLWDAIYKSHELCLVRYIIIKGSFSCKDDRVFVNEEELISGINFSRKDTFRIIYEEYKKIYDEEIKN